MKKIICYGDSNTFGYNPKNGKRFNKKIRWTSILQKNLDEAYKVINEGVSDRTGFVKNSKGFLFSAQLHFPKMLSKINNIDILILAIGTNDLQFQYNISLDTIKKGLDNLIKLSQRKAKNIIIIPPVILNEKVLEGFFSYQFNEKSVLKSKKIGKIYKQIANENNYEYFDINKFTKPSDFDGLHYDATAHKLIADKLTEVIKVIEQNNSTQKL